MSGLIEAQHTDLLDHLREQRGRLIFKMANAHQRGGDVAGWLPLLAQTQAAIEAVDELPSFAYHTLNRHP